MNPDRSILTRDFSEQRWVDQISKNFDDEVDHDIVDVPVCVFSVPESTTHFKPEAYEPLAIALGPYHHFKTHLYQMERYKVAAVKALLNHDQVVLFESLVIDRLKEKEAIVRGCYHKYMDLDDDTLAWIIAIDGLFLLGLFKNYGDIAPLMPKKLINHGVLCRDVMVLENQIPLYLLNEIWTSLFRTDEHELLPMMWEFCEVHSPLELGRELNRGFETSYLHLLDLMYHLIVGNQPSTQSLEFVPWKNTDYGMEEMNQDHKFVKNIPWEKISNLLGIKLNEEYKDSDPLSVTEVEIPSVSSLNKYAQINFCHVNGGIGKVKFDTTLPMLYLPVITLNVYSDVILRNLIAYEVASSRTTRELAQYIDLMSGIVDSEVDVKLLKANGIIKGSMNDKEVANLFSGMNKYRGSTSGNGTIKKINEYYNNRPRVKAWRFIKKDLICSQKLATIVLTIFVSLLMVLYSFCDVYDCPRLNGRT